VVKKERFQMDITTKMLIIVVFLFGLFSPAFSQEWQEGTGIITFAHITREDAHRQALDKARFDALKILGIEVVGVDGLFSGESSAGNHYNNFIQLIHINTRGRIIDERIIFDGSEKQEVIGGESVSMYRVTIEAQIEMDTVKSDPGFNLQMKLNQETFHIGETMVIDLYATKDCYVTIFCMYSNDSLIVLLPTRYQSDNRLTVGNTLRIPPHGAYWDMPVDLAGEREYDLESLIAVATKEDIQFQVSNAVKRKGLIAQSDALLEINRWIVKIDADKRTEAWAFYRVSK